MARKQSTFRSHSRNNVYKTIFGQGAEESKPGADEGEKR